MQDVIDALEVGAEAKLSKLQHREIIERAPGALSVRRDRGDPGFIIITRLQADPPPREPEPEPLRPEPNLYDADFAREIEREDIIQEALARLRAEATPPPPEGGGEDEHSPPADGLGPDVPSASEMAEEETPIPLPEPDARPAEYGAVGDEEDPEKTVEELIGLMRSDPAAADVLIAGLSSRRRKLLTDSFKERMNELNNRRLRAVKLNDFDGQWLEDHQTLYHKLAETGDGG